MIKRFLILTTISVSINLVGMQQQNTTSCQDCTKGNQTPYIPCHIDQNSAINPLFYASNLISLIPHLDTSSLSDYQKAIYLYKQILERQVCLEGICHLALENFIINALINELKKPKNQIDFVNYVFVPLNLNINFQNFSNQVGQTPLYIASRYGHLDAVKALLQAGANPNVNIIDSSQEAPIHPVHAAVLNQHLDILNVFIMANAQLNKLDETGKTPLHHAVISNNDGLVKLLIYSGRTNVNIADYKGYTPLHSAVEQNNLPITLLLLKAGANSQAQITCGRLKGFTALDIARKNGFNDIKQILINDQLKKAQEMKAIQEIILKYFTR